MSSSSLPAGVSSPVHTQNKTGSTRLVHHFYYFGWPDFGVPESPTGVLTMLHHVRAIRRSGDQDAPAIIHCRYVRLCQVRVYLELTNCQHAQSPFPLEHLLKELCLCAVFACTIGVRLKPSVSSSSSPFSAGVGRTGTFIALDHLVHQVQAEGENAMIDIEALVSTMRAQRGTMVQASVGGVGAGPGRGE